MTTEQNGVTDAVEAELNAPETGPAEGSKGPDPEQWGDPEARNEAEYDPAEGEVKGPDPAEHGDRSEDPEPDKE